jgi:hypothetical protein
MYYFHYCARAHDVVLNSLATYIHVVPQNDTVPYKRLSCPLFPFWSSRIYTTRIFLVAYVLIQLNVAAQWRSPHERCNILHLRFFLCANTMQFRWRAQLTCHARKTYLLLSNYSKVIYYAIQMRTLNPDKCTYIQYGYASHVTHTRQAIKATFPVVIHQIPAIERKPWAWTFCCTIYGRHSCITHQGHIYFESTETHTHCHGPRVTPFLLLLWPNRLRPASVRRSTFLFRASRCIRIWRANVSGQRQRVSPVLQSGTGQHRTELLSVAFT